MKCRIVKLMWAASFKIISALPLNLIGCESELISCDRGNHWVGDNEDMMIEVCVQNCGRLRDLRENKLFL